MQIESLVWAGSKVPLNLKDNPFEGLDMVRRQKSINFQLDKSYRHDTGDGGAESQGSVIGQRRESRRIIGPNRPTA